MLGCVMSMMMAQLLTDTVDLALADDVYTVMAVALA